jgi:hypothetical protein
MSKVTLAFGSFVVGLCIGSLIFGSHTVTFAQAPAAPPPPQNPPSHRMIFKGGGAKGAGPGGTGVKMPGTIPTFIPLEQTPIFEDFTFSDESQDLDGIECTGCTFNNVTLRYSGGAYKLANATFTGTTRVELRGAAANTIAFLPLLQAIASGQRAEPPNPNRPVLKTATAKSAFQTSWASPYGGTQ